MTTNDKTVNEQEFAAFQAWLANNSASGSAEAGVGVDPIPPDAVFVTVHSADRSHNRTAQVKGGIVESHPGVESRIDELTRRVEALENKKHA